MKTLLKKTETTVNTMFERLDRTLYNIIHSEDLNKTFDVSYCQTVVHAKDAEKFEYRQTTSVVLASKAKKDFSYEFKFCLSEVCLVDSQSPRVIASVFAKDSDMWAFRTLTNKVLTIAEFEDFLDLVKSLEDPLALILEVCK